jgi:hypothetical protein
VLTWFWTLHIYMYYIFNTVEPPFCDTSATEVYRLKSLVVHFLGILKSPSSRKTRINAL